MLSSIKEIDISTCKNDLLKEYFSFKSENLDSVLFFQIGEFYETFFEDAKLLSDVTGVILGSRTLKDVGEILQTGIRVSNASFYIKKLLNANIKIVVATQYKDENDNCYRCLTRKYTKGTVIENDFLESSENNYIVAIYQISDNKFDFAYADVSTGSFFKTSLNNYQLVLELEKIFPDELLISKSQETFFKKIISKYNSTILDDKFFKEKKSDKAILKYCKDTQLKYNVKLNKIILYNPDNFLSLDQNTRQCLELTRTRRLMKKKGSLLWFLNYTKTPMGARLLRRFLSEPLIDVENILKRQNAVEEIIVNKQNLDTIEELLEKFCDLSRICAKISNETIYPKDLFLIVKNSKILSNLADLTLEFNSELLKPNKKLMDNILELSDIIEKSILEDAADELKSGSIIKDGYNSNLDFLRAKLEKYNTQISKYENKQKKTLEIEKLKIGYSKVIGYYIEIPKNKLLRVPDSYIRKQILSDCARYTSDELQILEDKISALQYKINQFEYELYCEIRKIASKFVEIIRHLAIDIARIDVFVSFAICALKNNLSKPVFNSNGIYIKEGYHPSLLKLHSEVIKNTTSLDNGHMIILTGANMCGKSTYLKHNAIICLLAQIGSYVPAKLADVTIFDKIFIRQGSVDDIVNNNSSFMVEMNDLKFILDNATKDSLVLLDEPAKSTSSNEGGAIARAYCEYLMDKIDAKTIIVTHNNKLTELEDIYPNSVSNYVIGNDNETGIIKDRHIKRGRFNSSLAINTAILANLPNEIIESAKSYLR